MRDTILIEGRVRLGGLMVELQELAELGRIEVAKVVVPAGRLAGSRPPPCRAGRIAVVDIELELRRHDRGVDRVRRKRL